MKSYQESVRHGAQSPREHFTEGDVAGTEAYDCNDLMQDLGTTLFPWQIDVLADWCAYNTDKTPSYITCGLDVPRQNGKNKILEALEVWRCAVCGWHVLHTAHRVKTTKRSFYRLLKYFTDPRHPEMCALVEKVRKTNGEEAIHLTNGASIEFISRTNGAARGFDDIQLVIYDEAQELTDSQYDSITYALSASSTGERQTIYTGTPPNNTSGGETFSRYFNGAMAGSAHKTCWSSWAAPQVPKKGATFDEIIDEVYLSNPSMGYVLDIDYTRSEYEGGNPIGFAHERLGWWSRLEAKAAAIPAAVWAKSAVEGISGEYNRKKCFGVKFTTDGTRYVVAGCKANVQGKYATEIIDAGSTEFGIDELAAWLMERRASAACVVIDGIGAADALCKELEGAPRGYVVRASTANVIAASAGLLDALSSGKCVHTTQPETDECAKRCPRRAIGIRGGWGFAPDADLEATPLEAMALSLWATRNTKRNPRRIQRLQ